ncbi:MAG: ABC transporter permease, partial [Thermoleophilaceae bacterium]
RPSAVGDDLRRFGALTWTLATTDFKLRFFGSALGYFWQLMRPILLFGVLYVVFTTVLPLGADTKFYAAFLLMDIVLFTFFSEATMGAVGAVVDRENLVRKIQFPRMVIPASVVLTAFFNLCVNFVAVLVFTLAQGVPITWRWLWLFPLVGILAFFCTGVAMLLSALYVRFRDVRPIWEVVLQALFYASAVIYPVERLEGHPTLERLVTLNPITCILTQTRHELVDPTAPSAASSANGAVWLLIPAAIVVGSFALGLWYFNREAPRIAEEL